MKNFQRTRRGILRPTAALAATGTLAAMLTACGSSGSSSAGSASGEYNVAYIGSKTVSFQNAVFQGLSSVPGVKATFIEVGFDVSKQSQAIQNAVASGKYKGIVVLPNSATGLIAAVNQAVRAGIQVYNVDSPIGTDPYSTKVQIKGQAGAVVADGTHDGEELGKLAVQACQAKKVSPCEVARIGGLPQFAIETELQNGVASALKAAGSKYRMLRTIYGGGYDANSGVKAAQDLLASQPGVDVVIATDPVMKGV